MLLLWPGEMRRKSEDDLGLLGPGQPCLLVPTFITLPYINENNYTEFLSCELFFKLLT